jgi:hypothetical protein
MSVNYNPTASKQNKKYKLSASNIPFISGVIGTGDKP